MFCNLHNAHSKNKFSMAFSSIVIIPSQEKVTMYNSITK